MSDTTPLTDASARTWATDPRHHVVLEASAGTGKTRVLVDRYLALLAAGVDPRHILAITFTRKAAAEMRERILTELRVRHPGVWQGLRDRADDIGVSTIDAFCFALLREFPLEAGLDPGFTLADETEVARLVEMSLDGTLRECRDRAATEASLRLVLAQMTLPRLAEGLRVLLERRFVAPAALRRFLGRHVGRVRDDGEAATRARHLLRDGLSALSGGQQAWVSSGPADVPLWTLARLDLQRLVSADAMTPAEVRAALDGLSRWVLTREGKPRQRPIPARAVFASPAEYQRHRDGLRAVADATVSARRGFDEALNVLLARGIRRVFRLAHRRYTQTLALHDTLDFSEVLSRAVTLLAQMDEFSRSRFRLEARYQHVLVDEFQDTSRLQWELVASLVASWGEGLGVAHEGPLPPSLFLVGDRKQSIYRFRDAEVGLLDEAVGFVRMLGGGPDVRQAISQSFRAHPDLLAFANDLAAGMVQPGLPPAFAFRYGPDDRFPLPSSFTPGQGPDGRLGMIAGEDAETCAAAVTEEVRRLLEQGLVTDRGADAPRRVRPGDIAILFRSRQSHREFERALAARAIPSYVYKGLGFYDADEIKDLVALIRVLAAPESDLRAAAFLRSGFVGLSDEALRRLAPRIAVGLTHADPAEHDLPSDDREALARVRAAWPSWLALVDRLPPADVLDRILATAAYAAVLRGRRSRQARENVKKFRALVRRIQSRGYATMARVAAHIDRLSAGDEANAAVDAADAVTLMTVHASKGLEFPIVFLVNLARGTGGVPPPLRVLTGEGDETPIVGVARYEPGASEAEQVREKEESKRLMYVAVTRARERLYLSAAAQRAGRITPGPGSLAAVCPPSLVAVLQEALAQPESVSWQGETHAHRFVVCPPPSAELDTSALDEGAERAETIPTSLVPLVTTHDVARGRVIDEAGGVRDVSPRSGSATGPGDDLVVGRAVHRLLARSDDHDRDAVLEARVIADLEPDERLAVDDVQALARDVVAVVRAVWREQGLGALLRSPSARFEVPIAVRLDEGDRVRVLRGSIDCVVVEADRWLVLEFKTGRPSPAHQRQLDLYVGAVRAMAPDGPPVEGRLVYAAPRAIARDAAPRLPFD